MSNNNDRVLNYGDVAAIASAMTGKGHKITLEKIRRTLGYGCHAEIATFLRKWQSNNNSSLPRDQKQNKPGWQNDKRQSRNKYKNKYKDKDNRFYQYDKEEVSEPFSKDRFDQELFVVRSLFLAIYEVRQQKSKILEDHQQMQDQLLEYCSHTGKNIIQTKKTARIEINELKVEAAKIKNDYKREKLALREKLE